MEQPQEKNRGCCRPWGLAACDTGSLTHADLDWSRPSMTEWSLPKQGPDGPASRLNPDGPCRITPINWLTALPPSNPSDFPLFRSVRFCGFSGPIISDNVLICDFHISAKLYFSYRWVEMDFNRCQPLCSRLFRVKTSTVSESDVWAWPTDRVAKISQSWRSGSQGGKPEVALSRNQTRHTVPIHPRCMLCSNIWVKMNKLNPISRSDKVRLLVNQSISLIFLRFIYFLSTTDCSFKLQWLSACVAVITSSFVNMSSLVWKFFQWQRRTMPLLFATHVQQGFREEEQRHQVLTQQILYLTWKVIIAAKLY